MRWCVEKGGVLGWTTSLEAQVSIPNLPPIENKWEVFSSKDKEDIFKNHHNRSAKHTLKLHVQKLNEIFLG